MARRTFGVLAIARRHPLLFAALAALTACGGAGSDPFDQAPAASCTPRVVSVALLGDSTQYGIDGWAGHRVQTDPGKLLQAAMNARFGKGVVVVTNYGVPGQRATQAQRVEADVIVENYGINDAGPFGEPVEAYVAALDTLGATLIETQSPVTRESQPLELQARYAGAAAALGPVADVFGYVTALPDWQSYIGPDGVHPGQELYRLIVRDVMAPAVAQQVAPLRCEGSAS